MSDTSDHEAKFHDHGERVDEPYPQMSENPLRTGVAKITTDNADGTYVVDEQVHTGAAWADGESPGQYMGATVRDINDSTDGDVDDLVFFWEQYDQDGAIELVCAVQGTLDEKVATANGETPDYLENVLFGDGAWIQLTEAGGTIVVGHIGPDTALYCIGCCGGCAYWPVYIELDCVGHVRIIYMGDDDEVYSCGGPCA